MLLLTIFLVITVTLPFAWLIADLRGTARVRRTLGVAAILCTFAFLCFTMSLREYNAKVSYRWQTERLLQEAVRHLEVGKTEAVIRELSRANQQMFVSSDDRGAYKQIVDQAIYGMRLP